MVSAPPQPSPKWREQKSSRLKKRSAVTNEKFSVFIGKKVNEASPRKWGGFFFSPPAPRCGVPKFPLLFSPLFLLRGDVLRAEGYKEGVCVCLCEVGVVFCPFCHKFCTVIWQKKDR
jgi:hypothetical protein